MPNSIPTLYTIPALQQGLDVTEEIAKTLFALREQSPIRIDFRTADVAEDTWWPPFKNKQVFEAPLKDKQVFKGTTATEWAKKIRLQAQAEDRASCILTFSGNRKTTDLPYFKLDWSGAETEKAPQGWDMVEASDEWEAEEPQSTAPELSPGLKNLSVLDRGTRLHQALSATIEQQGELDSSILLWALGQLFTEELALEPSFQNRALYLDWIMRQLNAFVAAHEKIHPSEETDF